MKRGHDRAVAARRLDVVAGEHDEAGGVVVLVLDVVAQDLEAVDLRGQRRRDRGLRRVRRLGDLAGGAGGVAGDHGVRPSSRITLRHWPSACTWLCTVRMLSSGGARAPPSARTGCAGSARRRCAGSESGRKWWMSATRPAIELSIGIIARSASPPSTAAKTSSNDAHGDRLPVGVVLLAHQVGVGAGLALVGDAPGGRVRGHRRHFPTARLARPRDDRRLGRSVGPWDPSLGRPGAGPRSRSPSPVVALRRTQRGARRRRGRAARGRPRAAAGGRRAQRGGRRRAAAPRGRAVRRVRRHGRPPVVVAGAARRRRPRGRAHLDPRPQRGPHLRQDITGWTCEQQLSPEEEESRSPTPTAPTRGQRGTRTSSRPWTHSIGSSRPGADRVAVELARGVGGGADRRPCAPVIRSTSSSVRLPLQQHPPRERDPGEEVARVQDHDVEQAVVDRGVGQQRHAGLEEADVADHDGAGPVPGELPVVDRRSRPARPGTSATSAPERT